MYCRLVEESFRSSHEWVTAKDLWGELKVLLAVCFGENLTYPALCTSLFQGIYWILECVYIFLYKIVANAEDLLN